ncbi:MAG: hypothetical protein LLG00_13650, partial [Planctomycetaceae bacterium]|nr:hypothetical protein [Planctomycetaceae bacterium]
CTLDDGRFPTGSQGRIQWEGLDGTAIEAIASIPLDAGRAESFLQLAERLSDAMGIEQSGVLVFAHWPGRVSPWYDDLRRIAKYGSVLGTFSTMNDYFEQSGIAATVGRHQPDEYHSPYLKQDVAAGRHDPISRWVRYVRRRALFEMSQALDAMAASVTGTTPTREDDAPDSPARLTTAIDDSLAAGDDRPALDKQLAEITKKPLAELARSLLAPGSSMQRGCLIVNPCSFSQTHLAAASVVDVPAMGFAWQSDQPEPLAPPAAARRSWFFRRAKATPPLAESNVLRNEFCEIHFDPQTGAIRSISDYHSRDPRLAQQIALRLPDGRASAGEAEYSTMAADDMAVTSAGPVLGEMVCRGRLLNRDGRRLAGFRQTTRLWRGSRVVELRIDLDIDRLPTTNPWDSYYAVRFAWKDETAALYRSVNLATVPTELTQIESPHFLDLRRGRQQTTLLCGGLPYHRRFGRKLDTLLVVHGETARSFRLGIGFDLPQPTAAALAFIAPSLVLPDQPPPPTPTGWFFHLDCRNVVATHWEPLRTEDPLTGHQTCVSTGFRVRLLETDGRTVRLGLRSFRPIASARRITPGEMQPVDLAVTGDRIEVPLAAYQWSEVEVQFAPADGSHTTS